MKSIEERESTYLKIQELINKKNKLLNKMSCEIEIIKEKYMEPMKSIEKEIEEHKDFIIEREKKLSIYSEFSRKDIIEALQYILSEIYQKEFEYNYVDALTTTDNFGFEYGVGILAPKEVSDTFIRSDKGVDVSWLMYRPERINDMILIHKYRIPVVTDENITFYSLDGTRTVDQRRDNCIYEFIDCLIDYRWVYDKDAITKDEIMNKAESFIEAYKKNKTENKKYVDDSKSLTQTKNVKRI